jgi:hypothetical protein
MSIDRLYDINIRFDPTPTTDNFKNLEGGLDEYWADWLGDLTDVIKKSHPNYEPLKVWIKKEDDCVTMITITTEEEWMLKDSCGTNIHNQGCFPDIDDFLYNTFDDVIVTNDGNGYDHVV